MTTNRPRTLLQHGVVVGRHHWVARRLYQRMGGWVTAIADAPTKVRVATDARRFALHAQALAPLIPVVPTIELPSFEPDDDDPLREIVESAEGPIDCYAVTLPAWVAAIDRDLAHSSPVTDGALVRVLTHLRADLA